MLKKQARWGWALNAGGTISRNIIGHDDWDGSTYFGNGLPDLCDGKGVAGNLQDGCTLHCYDETGTGQTLYDLNLQTDFEAVPHYDFEPDLYYFNLPGGSSGKFILKRDGTAVLQNQSKVLITANSDGTSWEIKDVNGFIYDFNAYEICKNYDAELYPHMSAWHLTKITSPNGNFITYYYSDPIIVHSIGQWSETKDDFYFPGSIGAANIHLVSPESGWNDGHDYYTLLLDSIGFTNGVVKFKYSGNREDLSGDEELDKIQIFSKDAFGNNSLDPIKVFAFSYNYFNGGDNAYQGNGQMATGTLAKRLKLLQESGNADGNKNTINPYIFSYYEGGFDDLPAKNSFGKDHWGYSNGKHNQYSLIPSFQLRPSSDPIINQLGIQGSERDANPQYVTAFSLKSVQIPDRRIN